MSPQIKTYSVDDFWRFVYERQSIWHRRFVEKLPPPWTEDPILQQYHFCNVYRELDYGTVWYKKQVVPKAQDSADLLWMTILYRLVNSVEVFETIWMPPFHLWKKSIGVNWRNTLLSLDRPLDSLAYLTLSQPHFLHTRAERLPYILDLLWGKIPAMLVKIGGASNLFDVWSVLKTPYGVGDFVAFQVLRDLVFADMLHGDENSFSIIGPGAIAPLEAFSSSSKFPAQYLTMHSLRVSQREAMERLELPMPFYQGKELCLCDIEQALCEYRKHVAWSSAARAKRRRFTPSHDSF